jgi:hypothetical protein
MKTVLRKAEVQGHDARGEYQSYHRDDYTPRCTKYNIFLIEAYHILPWEELGNWAWGGVRNAKILKISIE